VAITRSLSHGDRRPCAGGEGSAHGRTVVSPPNDPELVIEQGAGTAPIRVTVTKN
jgi:hypothetical protein